MTSVKIDFVPTFKRLEVDTEIKPFESEDDELNDFLLNTELKDALFHYYCQKVSEEGKRIWNEHQLSNEAMNEMLNTHIRTPCK